MVYSNQLKTEFAGVPREMIERHGAVSREVAAALAEGVRYRCEATLGVGITGVAGPSGGTPDKPVGLVFHAVASDRGTEVVQRNINHGAGYGAEKADVKQLSAISCQLLVVALRCVQSKDANNQHERSRQP